MWNLKFVTCFLLLAAPGIYAERSSLLDIGLAQRSQQRLSMFCAARIQRIPATLTAYAVSSDARLWLKNSSAPTTTKCSIQTTSHASFKAKLLFDKRIKNMYCTLKGYRTLNLDDSVIIFARQDETVDIVCENEVPLARCGYTHPNGTKILFTNVTPGTPSCKYTTAATGSDIGVWTCHFWPQTSPQEETKKSIEIRVAHKFAAVEREMRVRAGEEVSLSCVSTEGRVPLNYCYFTTPELKTIHMDDGMTSTNARYSFPSNKSLHRGDCGITIGSVSSADDGVWACSGWLESEHRQFTDNIQLVVETEASFIDNEPITVSLTTFVCSTLGFLCFFVALIYWKYRYYSTYYGKTWGDDVSIDSYVVKQRIDVTPFFVSNDYLLNT